MNEEDARIKEGIYKNARDIEPHCSDLIEIAEIASSNPIGFLIKRESGAKIREDLKTIDKKNDANIFGSILMYDFSKFSGFEDNICANHAMIYYIANSENITLEGQIIRPDDESKLAVDKIRLAFAIDPQPKRLSPWEFYATSDFLTGSSFVIREFLRTRNNALVANSNRRNIDYYLYCWEEMFKRESYFDVFIHQKFWNFISATDLQIHSFPRRLSDIRQRSAKIQEPV